MSSNRRNSWMPASAGMTKSCRPFQHTIRKILLLLIVIFIFSLPAQAIELKVNRRVLPNGLILLHVERHNLPVVKVSMMVKASPLDEPAAKAGLANLTAELLTEGTKNRTSEEISSQIEFLGASVGASADEDYTSLGLSVLKKDLDKGFEIFSDVLMNPTFPDKEIMRVKKIIKDDLQQQEEDPSFVAEKAFREAIYKSFPYGRLVPGSPETIDTITREDLVKFHSDYYVPANAILSVVGDITEEELNALLDKFLKDWASKPVPPRNLQQPEPVTKKEVVLIDRELTQASILYGNLGIKRDNPDYYAVSVMNYILGGGGFASRLMAEIRDKMGLAYDVHSIFTSNKEEGVFEVGVQTKNQSAPKVIELIRQGIEEIMSKPVTAEELSDAKAYLTGSFPRRLDTMSKIADMLAAIEFYGLGLDYIQQYPDYINAVTADDVLRVAKKYLTPEEYVLVVVGNQSQTGLKESSGAPKPENREK
jgi:zinc protease